MDNNEVELQLFTMFYGVPMIDQSVLYFSVVLTIENHQNYILYAAVVILNPLGVNRPRGKSCTTSNK